MSQRGLFCRLTAVLQQKRFSTILCIQDWDKYTFSCPVYCNHSQSILPGYCSVNQINSWSDQILYPNRESNTRLLQLDECHTTVTIQSSTIRVTGNIFQFLVRDTSAAQDKTKDFLAALDVIRAEINHVDPTDLYLIAYFYFKRMAFIKATHLSLASGTRDVLTLLCVLATIDVFKF